MNLRRQRLLCIEIYKTLNKLNLGYMNDIFKLGNTDRLTREKCKLNLEIPKPSEGTFGTIYRPPHYSNLLVFFKEPGKYLNQACENYDYFIVMRDFNIDVRQTSPEPHKLDKFCSLFSLTSIIKSDTCFTIFHSSTIDPFLTKKPNLFQKTNTIETGLSDHHLAHMYFFEILFRKA